jgi:hypothetical protein
MKTVFNVILCGALVAAAALRASAAEESVAGKWKSQFDSQIGVQKYLFEFKVETNKLKGRAISEREMGTNDDEISFVEPLKFNDQEIRIEYTGKIKGDEMKLHRKVGDLAEYDIVATRVKDDESKSEKKSDTKSEGGSTTNSPAKR